MWKVRSRIKKGKKPRKCVTSGKIPLIPRGSSEMSAMPQSLSQIKTSLLGFHIFQICDSDTDYNMDEL